MSFVRQTQSINNFYEPENNPWHRYRNIEEGSHHSRYTPTNNDHFRASVEDQSTSQERVEIKDELKKRIDALRSEFIKNRTNLIKISIKMGYAKGWFSNLVTVNSSTHTITQGKLKKLERVASKLLRGTTINLSDLSKPMFTDRVTDIIVPYNDAFFVPVSDKSTCGERLDIKGELDRRIDTLRRELITCKIPMTRISTRMGHRKHWLSNLKSRGPGVSTITREKLEKLEKVASEAFGTKSVNLSDPSKPLFTDRVTSVVTASSDVSSNEVPTGSVELFFGNYPELIRRDQAVPVPNADESIIAQSTPVPDPGHKKRSSSFISNNLDKQAQGTKKKWGHIPEIVEGTIPQAVVISRNSRNDLDAGDFFSSVSVDPYTEREIETSCCVRFIEDD